MGHTYTEMVEAVWYTLNGCKSFHDPQPKIPSSRKLVHIYLLALIFAPSPFLPPWIQVLVWVYSTVALTLKTAWWVPLHTICEVRLFLHKRGAIYVFPSSAVAVFCNWKLWLYLAGFVTPPHRSIRIGTPGRERGVETRAGSPAVRIYIQMVEGINYRQETNYYVNY